MMNYIVQFENGPEIEVSGAASLEDAIEFALAAQRQIDDDCGDDIRDDEQPLIAREGVLMRPSKKRISVAW